MDYINRAKNILLQPKPEWTVIAAERDDVRTIYLQYVMILSAIPPVIGVLRAILFAAAFGRFAASVGYAMVAAVVGYVLTLVMVYVVALIADWLASAMGGERNFVQSLKLVAYSMTASWVGAIFTIVPILGWLVALLAGLYGIYIFYSGVAVMKKIADAKVVAYMVVVIVAALVAGWVIGAVINVGAGIGMMGPHGKEMMGPGMGHF